MHLTKNQKLINRHSHLSDTELLSEFNKSKDNYWLSILLPRYSILVFGVCMKYLKNEQNAKDSTQQIFEKCIDELHKYEVTYFKSWLYMITKNYCLMQLRKVKPMVEIEQISYQLKEVDNSEQINDLHLKDVTLDLMHEALDELSEEQKICIKEFYLNKKSYQQIAAQLNLNYLQVKSFIQNGKRNLKIIIQKKLSKIYFNK